MQNLKLGFILQLRNMMNRLKALGGGLFKFDTIPSQVSVRCDAERNLILLLSNLAEMIGP
jgi:hypothetical protein